MAKKIQMWRELGPQLKSNSTIEPETVVESLIDTTNQTKGSIMAVLSELDVFLVNSLKAGRPVKLPNGMIFRPYGKKDGSISINLHLPKEMEKKINIGQRAEWINAGHVGKTEDELIAIWNERHPDDPVEP